MDESTGQSLPLLILKLHFRTGSSHVFYGFELGGSEIEKSRCSRDAHVCPGNCRQLDFAKGLVTFIISEPKLVVQIIQVVSKEITEL